MLRRIGGGAYGEVWLARNFIGSHFAIKVVHRCLFDHDRPFERELEGIRRFEPISRSHPSQVAIHQVGQNTAEGYFYYVMDLADDAAAEDGGRTTDDRGQRAEVRGQGSAVSGQRSPRSAICDLRSSTSPAPHLPPATCHLPCPEAYVPKTLKRLLHIRGRLPPAECLDIALSLTTALEHLHSHGLVHRDIKPSNVIFVGGMPKMADIGLVTSIDATRSFVGTEGFFPPEGPGTVRADLFSLGKLLYEIATGKDRREFPELPADLPSPQDQEALSELNAVILKACQHDPALRYASASALRGDLERLRQGRSVKRRRAWQRRWSRVRPLALPVAVGAAGVWALVIALRPHTEPGPADRLGADPVRAGAATAVGGAPAGWNSRGVFVLPFRPADSNGAPADLCSRITDAFIDALGSIDGVQRSPRKCGWRYLEEGALRRALAQTNDMSHVLSGCVSSTGGSLVIALRLYQRDADRAVWSETFLGTTNATIELERRGLSQLAGKLGIHISELEQRKIDRVLTNNMEALHWYRQAGLAYTLRGGTQVGYKEVRELAQNAINLDPRYLDADLLDAYIIRNLAQDRAPSDVWPDVQRRMVSILHQDDTVAGALDHAGGFTLVAQRDWEGTHALWTRRLLYEDPQRTLWIRAFYRRVWGAFAQAHQDQEISERPEPVGTDQRFFMAASRWVERRYSEGACVARRTLELYPGHAEGYFWLAHCLVAKGDYPPGIQAIEAAQRVWKKQEMTALLGFAYARMGRTDKVQEVLTELHQLDQTTSGLRPYFIARVYAALGQKADALHWLEQAEQERSEYLFFVDLGGLRTDLAWDGLQDEPRYWALCDRLGLGKDQWPRKVDLP